MKFLDVKNEGQVEHIAQKAMKSCVSFEYRSMWMSGNNLIICEASPCETCGELSAHANPIEVEGTKRAIEALKGRLDECGFDLLDEAPPEAAIQDDMECCEGCWDTVGEEPEPEPTLLEGDYEEIFYISLVQELCGHYVRVRGKSIEAVRLHAYKNYGRLWCAVYTAEQYAGLDYPSHDEAVVIDCGDKGYIWKLDGDL